MKLIKKVKKGFTLVELVVVIAVIAILGAVSVGAYFGVTESAKASKLEQEAREALNNIRLIALSGNENHVLDSNGLHIVDIEIFEKELRKSSGINYDVISDINEGVSGQTIYLVEKVVSPSSGAPKVYSTLEYLTSEVEGKAGSIDVVNETYNKIDKTFTTTASYSNFEELQAAINKLGTTPTTIKLSGDIHVIDNLEINGKNLTLD